MKNGILILASAAALLGGCASNEPLKRQTASGFPEGVFRGTTLDDARSKLVATCVSRGAQLHDTGPNHVTCVRELEGMAAAGVQIAIGNSYSSTPIHKLRITIYQKGEDVHAVAHQWAETQMRSGQVNKMDFDSNTHKNNGQDFLRRAGAL